MRFLRSAERLPGGAHPSSASWRFTLAANARCFAGHFDGQAVLPGVAHIAIVLEACSLLNPSLPALVAVEDLRFMRPVRPTDACQVSIAAGPGSSTRFEIRCHDTVASRGVLVFAGAWAEP